MDKHIILLLRSFVTISILLTTMPCSCSQEDSRFSVCSQSLYSCGSLANISYPFWGQDRPSFCGSRGFALQCLHNQTTSIQIGSQNFTVLEINETDFTMRMVRSDIAYDVCAYSVSNTSLSGSHFSFLPTVQNLTILYNCSSEVSTVVNNSFTCGNIGANRSAFYGNETLLRQLTNLESCGVRVQVPVLKGIQLVEAEGGGVDGLKKALDEGFDVEYSADSSDLCTGCRDSGGLCGSAMNDTSHFSCHCRDGTHASSCSAKKSRKKTVLKLVLGFLATGIGLPLIAVIICRNKAKVWKFLKSKFGKIEKNDQHLESFLASQGPLPIKRYKFSDVKKITESFKYKLGEGGYGEVFKGKLPTGCSVAVKIVNESKGNGEEFINEVLTISKTSHVNVVTLLGFCFEGCKKALIYEYMPNGSLEKFLFNKAAETTCKTLSWENLYQISIGIAQGLEYLHKGCNMRILHFDIKPHNILLDENLYPKISDFGLAKLDNREESIVSISNARGTIGYVAPEVWNKSFGGVSHKSDVYSYGMMLLQMVGGQKNINVEANHTSEIYFPHLAIYGKVEMGNDLGDDEAMTQKENEIAKRMAMVGLWCIQTIPAHRPTITRVIEMLEGSMDSLEMPPKPVMSSPPRLEPNSFTTMSFQGESDSTTQSSSEGV